MTAFANRALAVDALQWDGTQTGGDSIVTFAAAFSPVRIVQLSKGVQMTLQYTLTGAKLALSSGDWLVRNSFSQYLTYDNTNFVAVYV